MQHSSTQMQRVAVQQTYVLRWSWSGVNLCGERKKKKQNNQPSNMRWEKTTRKLTKKITFRLRAIAEEKLEHLEKERNKEFFSTVKKSGSTIKKDWKISHDLWELISIFSSQESNEIYIEKSHPIWDRSSSSLSSSAGLAWRCSNSSSPHWQVSRDIKLNISSKNTAIDDGGKTSSRPPTDSKHPTNFNSRQNQTHFDFPVSYFSPSPTNMSMTAWWFPRLWKISTNNISFFLL